MPTFKSLTIVLLLVFGLFLQTVYGQEKAKKKSDELDLAVTKIANTAFFLAQALYQQGKYTEAVETYQKAASFKKNDDIILSAFAMALLHSGKYAEADSVIQVSLEIRRKNLGTKHPKFAHNLYQLGIIYASQRKHKEAEQFYQRALAIQESSLEKNHLDKVSTMQSYAKLLRETDRISEALDMAFDAEMMLARLRGLTTDKQSNK